MDQTIGTHTQILQSQNDDGDRSIRRRPSESHLGNRPLQPGGGSSEITEAEEPVSIAQDLLEIESKRQDKGKTYINLWHDPITAHLLPEIVSQIFIFAACADPEFYPLHNRHYTDHPVCASLLLAHVCQRWRDIALATPQLWTNIGIDIWKHATQLDVTEELLLRSRSLSLNLTFYQGEEVDPSMFIGPEQNLILDVIRCHSARWKFIELDSEMYEGTPIIHDLVHELESIPTSDYLELRLGAMTCRYSVALPKPFRPRVFHSFESNHITLIPLQWDNLTHLKVASYDASDILDIVRQAPRLTEMRTARLDNHYMDRRDGPRPPPTTPVTHSGLRILCSEHFFDDGVNITNHLTLPALQHLDLDNEFCQLDDLINFLNRSKLDPGSLQMFRLRHGISGETYNHRFVELTALTDLMVHFDRSTWPRLLHSYLSELSEPSSLPRLRHLSIHVSYDFDHVSPSPASWALLSGICQARTLDGDKATAVSTDSSLEELTLDQSTTDKTGSSKADTTSILLPGTYQQCHRRPLETLSFQGCSRPNISSMEKEVMLRFLEVQRAGRIKLKLIDKHGDDVLKTMAELYGC